MLTLLHVRDLAVLLDATLSPGRGLNVLTGETGAGKSLVVQALELALGGRADGAAVRAGADQAIVEAVFTLDDAPASREALAEAGYEDDGELLVRRVVSREGRGGAWLNGAPVTLAVLRRTLAGLVDLTGQHESVLLLKEGARLDALDAYGGMGAGREAVRAAWDVRSEAWAALSAMREAARDRADRLDLLRGQVRDLDALDPRAGEDEELRHERERLRHAGRLLEGCGRAEAALYGDEGAAKEKVDQAGRAVATLARIDPDLAPVARDLEAAAALIEDAAFTLSRYVKDVEGDPARLDAVETRLAALERAERRHGCAGAGELAACRQALARTLADLEDADDTLARLEAAAAVAQERYDEAAATLSGARRVAARALGAAVQERVRGLGMPKALFRVQVAPREAGPRGADTVGFVLGPNPGEEALPLARIASGGELSRTLLALKGALAEADRVPVQVFDEVDAGVAGQTAQTLGRCLREVSRRRQVLVITHQPHVAAHGDHHFRLEKREVGGRTEAVVSALDAAGREAELARMLGGASTSGRALGLARELLHRAAEAP